MADIVQTCTQCGKKFLIIDQEQKFLKGKGLLLPMLCPDDRQVKRIKDRGERVLYRTTCQQCGANMITSYDPNKSKSMILCQKCYLAYFEKNDPIQP